MIKLSFISKSAHSICSFRSSGSTSVWERPTDIGVVAMFGSGSGIIFVDPGVGRVGEISPGVTITLKELRIYSYPWR